jgi:hypothetical protein
MLEGSFEGCSTLDDLRCIWLWATPCSHRDRSQQVHPASIPPGVVKLIQMSPRQTPHAWSKMRGGQDSNMEVGIDYLKKGQMLNLA